MGSGWISLSPSSDESTLGGGVVHRPRDLLVAVFLAKPFRVGEEKGGEGNGFMRCLVLAEVEVDLAVFGGTAHWGCE